jgi:hypothetical protein
MRDQVLQAQALYRLEFTPKTPASISQPLKLGDAPRIVDEMADHVLIRYIRVMARAQSEADKDNAEKRSKFLSGFWHVVFQQSQWNPVRQAVKNFPMCGVSALKIVPDVPMYEHMMEEPESEQGETDDDYRKKSRRRKRMMEYMFPFWVTAPNPAWLCWDLSPRRPQWIGEKSTRLGEDIIDEFPELAEKLNPDNNYNCDEYWDEDTMAFVVQGTGFAIYRENRIGIPYAVKFGGTGSVDEQMRPENLAAGLLTRERQAIIENSTTYNQTISVTRRLAWPNYFTDLQELVTVLPGHGKVILLDNLAGEHFQRVDLGTVDPSLFSLMEKQQAVLDRETTPSILRGIRQPGTSSAAEAAIQNQNVRMMLEAMLSATKGMLELCNVTVLRCIDEWLVDGIRVYGRSPYGWDYDQKVDSSDIDGAYANDVEIMAGPPEDLDRQADASLRQLTAGARSLPRHLREGTREQDPETELAAIITDAAMRSPEVIAMVAQAIGTLTQMYLMEKGLNVAQRSLAQTQSAEGAELSETEVEGTPTFAQPSSPEREAATAREIANAGSGGTRLERRLVP